MPPQTPPFMPSAPPAGYTPPQPQPVPPHPNFAPPELPPVTAPSQAQTQPTPPQTQPTPAHTPLDSPVVDAKKTENSTKKPRWLGLALFAIGGFLVAKGGYPTGYGNANITDGLLLIIGAIFAAIGLSLLFGRRILGSVVGVILSFFVLLYSATSGSQQKLREDVHEWTYTSNGGVPISDIAASFEAKVAEITDGYQEIIDAHQETKALQSNIIANCDQLEALVDELRSDDAVAQNTLSEIQALLVSLHDDHNEVMLRIGRNVQNSLEGRIGENLAEAGSDPMELSELIARTTSGSISKNDDYQTRLGQLIDDYKADSTISESLYTGIMEYTSWLRAVHTVEEEYQPELK
jgi:hypothetical protein